MRPLLTPGHPSAGEPCAHCDLPLPPARRTPAGSPAFCCFGCRIAHDLARPALDGTAPTVGGTLLLRLGLGIFLSMNIMAFGWLSYGQELFGNAAEPYPPLAALFAYLLMFLCTIVVVLLGVPLAADALASLAGSRGRRIDTNLLIGLGVGSAYALSVAHTLRGSGSLYYDTAAMVLVLVTLGNYLEAQAKRRATRAGETLLGSDTDAAWIERDGVLLELGPEDVRIGDRVRVRPGEAIPVDGAVVEGRSRIDESNLTGESTPRSVGPADAVLGGSLSLDGLLWIRATRVGADRVVAQMRHLLHEARRRQPPIQRLADRIAQVFVPAVVLLALGLFGRLALQGRLVEGLFVALGVLLISCPCALGLAAPLATWNALRRLAAGGVLVNSAVTLERAAGVSKLYFDKTGTLTGSEPRLGRIVTARDVSERRALHLAATLETASLHPIARAVIAEARCRGLHLASPSASTVLPGLGIEARVEGRSYRLGNDRLLASLDLGHDLPADDGTASAVYLCEDRRVLARFELHETPREDAKPALAWLADLGIDVAVLTGDRSGPAARLAGELGLPCASRLLPEDKLRRLTAGRRGTSGRIAMVGDGVNDAPVLAGADVGIAIGSAAPLAKHAGNVRLISDRLDRVPWLVATARHAHRRIRLNLLGAFAYNALGIPLAATGLLSPIFAACAMIASSLTIVALSRGAGDVPLGGARDAGRTVVERPVARRAPAPAVQGR